MRTTSSSLSSQRRMLIGLILSGHVEVTVAIALIIVEVGEAPEVKSKGQIRAGENGQLAIVARIGIVGE